MLGAGKVLKFKKAMPHTDPGQFTGATVADLTHFFTIPSASSSPGLLSLLLLPGSQQ